MIDGTLAPFLPQVHWFLEEEQVLHIIVVRLKSFRQCKTLIGISGILSSGQSFCAHRSTRRFEV
jgi:hypothetical protein